VPRRRLLAVCFVKLNLKMPVHIFPFRFGYLAKSTMATRDYAANL
jgi:hypothetical protein